MVESKFFNSYLVNGPWMFQDKPDGLKAYHRFATAMPAVIVDGRDPELQMAASYSAARLMRLEPNEKESIRKAIDAAIQACKGGPVKDRLVWAAKELAKPARDFDGVQSVMPKPIPAPPEIF